MVQAKAYLNNANRSLEAADGIRFSDALGQASWWHGLSLRATPYTHSEWELWELPEEWKKGARKKVWSVQSTSEKPLTKPS